MIHNASSEQMSDIDDESVHLVVTSPPYNVGMEYETVIGLDEYRETMRRVWKECSRVLVDGGRLCINVAGTGRQPYIPLQAYTSVDLIEMGFIMRGDIVWNKGTTSSGFASTAWGSWCRPTNPCLRDIHEYILVFSKGVFGRADKDGQTINDKEFMEYTLSTWNVSTESASRIGHPAPFPIAIPYRLIKLYSFEGDTVLDPFMGSGTTAIAARQLKRGCIGYEVNPEYVALANGRLAQMELF